MSEILTIGNDGTKNGGKCEFAGVFGSFWNLMALGASRTHGYGYVSCTSIQNYLNYLLSSSCVLVGGDSIGSYDESTQRYSGLLGMLQRGV